MGCGSPGSEVASLASCISAIEAAGGDPTIVNTFGTTGVLDGVGGVQLLVGFAGPTDQFNGYVDGFTIEIDGSDTTFDFEPASATPIPAAFPLFATGFGVMGLLARRKKKKQMAVA